MKMQPEQLQLQTWDGALKRYIPISSNAARGRAWRLCKPQRSTVNPKLRRTPRYSGSHRSVREVCAEYCEWARVKGLRTVTNWKHAGRVPGFVETRLVDVKTCFEVTK